MPHLARLSLLAVAVAIPLVGVEAQPYPSRPITIISPVGAGAPQDVIIRTMAEIMSKEFGQPIVVENKPGASLTLGPATMAATSRPDGYTVSAIFSTLVLVSQMNKVPYDPFKDFTYIVQVARFPLGIAIKSDSKITTWAELVAHAKNNPTTVTYGSPGTGTNAHLGMELLLRTTGVQMTHIPHQGPMPIITAVLGGHVTLQVSGMEWKPHVDQGDMRLLAMLTDQRHLSFPNVPSISELGFPFDVSVPMGFAGPKGMDPAVVQKLHDGFKKASEDPRVRALYQKLDIDYHYADGQGFRQTLEAIGSRMRPVIEQLGLLAKS
jgi:tripartite-type tricarboxylate transporter receptor subunit TctC